MKREAAALAGHVAPLDTGMWWNLVKRSLEPGDTAVRTASIVGALIVFVVGIPLALVLNIWTDEAFTLHSTGAGPLAAWHQAVVFETQPPLYFVLVGALRLIDEHSIWLARLPSIVFAAGAVVLLVRTALRVAPGMPSAAVALVTALNPLVIWAAVEMRVYALVLLIGAALSATFIEGFLVEKPSQRARFAYGFCAVAGLYTQYYIGFFLAAQCLTLIIVRRRAVPAFVLTGACISFLFAPFLPIALAQSRASSGFVEQSSFVHVAREMLNSVFAYILPHMYLHLAPHDPRWSGGIKVGAYLLAAALLSFIAVVGRPTLAGSLIARATVLQALCSTGLFIVVLALTGTPDSVPVHTIVIAPVWLLTALLLVSAVTRRKLLIGAASSATFLVFTARTFWVTYHPPLAKFGEWERVAATIQESPRGIPVAVFPAESALPLGWYLHTTAISIPRSMPFTSRYVQDTALTKVSDVAHVLNPVRSGAQRLWLVTSGCDRPHNELYDYRCDYLTAYVRANYDTVAAYRFFGSQAQLLSRRDQTVHRSV